VRGQVAEEDIAPPEGLREDVLDVRTEGMTIVRAIEHPGGACRRAAPLVLRVSEGLPNHASSAHSLRLSPSSTTMPRRPGVSIMPRSRRCVICRLTVSIVRPSRSAMS